MEENLVGKKKADGETIWLACINLSPWQKHKLLEVCISMNLRDVEQNGKIIGEAVAVEINSSDYDAILFLISQENIHFVKYDARGS